MIEDNIYFIDTPPDVQDEVFYQILEKLENLNIRDNVYLKLVSSINIPNKHYFNVYTGKSFNPNAIPEFLIFIQ